MAHVRFNVYKCKKKKKKKERLELVGGGPVINGTTLSSYLLLAMNIFQYNYMVSTVLFHNNLGKQ